MRYLPLFLAGILLSPAGLYAAPPAKPSLETAKREEDSKKISAILDNQKEILKQLAELKQEVLIVKARATR